jgi:hypothetical protein
LTLAAAWLAARAANWVAGKNANQSNPGALFLWSLAGALGLLSI